MRGNMPYFFDLLFGIWGNPPPFGEIFYKFRIRNVRNYGPKHEFPVPSEFTVRNILFRRNSHPSSRPWLELELIQTQMTQKPMLRAEVYARALRASQNRKEDSV